MRMEKKKEMAEWMVSTVKIRKRKRGREGVSERAYLTRREKSSEKRS